jgi:hypothetical protein
VLALEAKVSLRKRFEPLLVYGLPAGGANAVKPLWNALQSFVELPLLLDKPLQ